MQKHEEDGTAGAPPKDTRREDFERPYLADEDVGYEPDDPKHPNYHSRMSDLWDMREGK